MLTANDCRNAVALINRANIQGNEVEEVARIKAALLDHAALIDADDARPRIGPVDEPHTPTRAEILDMERG